MSIYDAVDCEAIEKALFDLLVAKLKPVPFVTIGRQHVGPPTLSSAQQPALFSVIVRDTQVGKPRGTTGMLTLHGVLIVYFQRSGAVEQPGNEVELGATKLNALKKAISNAIKPDDATGLQTLGGLVSHCWIEGDTERDPGVFTTQGSALIPIHILVP